MLNATRFLFIAGVVLGATGCLDHSGSTAPLNDTRWRYDPGAPYYGYLSVGIQQTRSEDPRKLADTVCAELAGELEFLGRPRQRGDGIRVAFICRMEEPGMAVSLDFGDLVRATDG